MASRQPLSFANLLRHHRNAAGLSQEGLAERAGLSRRGVSDIERGLKRPYKDTVERLADALGLAGSERAVFESAARMYQTLGARNSEGPVAPGAGVLRKGQFASELTPLVGRARELALISRHLHTQTPHRSSLLLLAGEPGIGKSRLLQEATARAPEAGWAMLSGGCVRRGGQEPFEPFVSMLARAVASAPPAQQRRDLAGCGWLARLLPELVDTTPVPAPTWELHPEQERRLMFAAVRRYLANIAGPAGILLVLDDLQWASADALDLLATLVRDQTEGPAPPIRLIAAYRTTEVRPSDPLARLLADLHRADLVTQARLAPLAAEDASELLDQLLAREIRGVGTAIAGQETEPPLPDDLRVEVLRRAAGIPFYLVSTARALLAEEENEEDDGRMWQVPWTVAQSIRARIAALPERARELLGMAAVIGRVVPSALLLTLVARTDGRADEDEAIAALEATCAAGLLVEQGSDFQFAHDLIRDVTLSDLSSARSRMLHRRVAEALTRLPDVLRDRHLSEITYHYQEAGDGAAALPYALRAGDHAASVYANEEAERLYALAIALASAHEDRRREAEALEKRATVLLRLARYSEALATIETSLSAYRALGDVEGEGRVAEGFQYVYFALATPELGIARLRPLLGDLRERGISQIGQARLYGALARLLARCGWFTASEEAAIRLADAIMTAERAMELARATGDEDVLARAMLNWAHPLVWVGRFEEGLNAIEGALPLAEAAGDLWTLFTGLIAAQAGREIRGDFDLSQQHIDRGLALSDRVGDPIHVAHMWHNQAELAYYRGDWALARTAIERSLSIVQAYDLGASFPDAQRYLSQIYLVAGEQGQADALVAEPLAIAEERHDLQALRMAYSLIAERDLLAGRAEVVRTYLQPLLDRPGLEEQQVLFVLPQFAWALLALGDEAEAEARAIQSCERARVRHHHLWLVDGLRVFAMVRIRQHRWEEAGTLLDEAIELCHGMPYPYAEAKALYVYGQLHVAKGEPEQAREQYQAALAICDRLCEGLYRPYIERALAALGAA